MLNVRVKTAADHPICVQTASNTVTPALFYSGWRGSHTCSNDALMIIDAPVVAAGANPVPLYLICSVHGNTVMITANVVGEPPPPPSPPPLPLSVVPSALDPLITCVCVLNIAGTGSASSTGTTNAAAHASASVGVLLLLAATAFAAAALQA